MASDQKPFANKKRQLNCGKFDGSGFSRQLFQQQESVVVEGFQLGGGVAITLRVLDCQRVQAKLLLQELLLAARGLVHQIQPQQRIGTLPPLAAKLCTAGAEFPVRTVIKKCPNHLYSS